MKLNLTQSTIKKVTEKIKLLVLLCYIYYFTVSVTSADVIYPGYTHKSYISPQIVISAILIGILVAITIAIELPIAIVYSLIRKLNLKRIALTCVLANLISCPIFFFLNISLLFYFRHSSFHNMITAYLEFIVILIEAVIYKYIGKVGWKDSLILSFAANFTSAILSGVIFKILHLRIL